MCVCVGGGGGGGGGAGGVLSKVYKRGGCGRGQRPLQLQRGGMGERCKLPHWGIKLQKDENFSYLFLRTKSKHEQRTQSAHTHFLFCKFKRKKKIMKCV